MTRLIQSAIIVFVIGFISAPLFAGDEKDEAAYRKIEAQLEATTIETLAYEDADVTEVVRDIAKRARVTIVFDKAALESVDEDDRKITMEMADVKAINALNIIIDQIGLYKTYKNGILYITTEEKSNEATVTKTYDVRDITVVIRDFPAPKLRLKPADDNDNGPIIDFPNEDKIVETDDIIEMIEDTVTADWGDTASVSVIKGQLIVRAPRNVHKEVADLLDQLRSAK